MSEELTAKVIEFGPAAKRLWDKKGVTPPPQSAVDVARRLVQVKAS